MLRPERTFFKTVRRMTLGVDVLYVWIPRALGSRDVGVSWEESACGSAHAHTFKQSFSPADPNGGVSLGSS